MLGSEVPALMQLPLLARLQFLYHPELPAKETYLSPGPYAYWVWCVSELYARN